MVSNLERRTWNLLPAALAFRSERPLHLKDRKSFIVSKTIVPTAKQSADFADVSIAIAAGLAFALIAIFLGAAPFTNEISGGRDFVAYWATGQQLIHHADPFDVKAMTRIEHAAGLSAESTVGFMRNPPWGLFLALPLGLIPLRLGTLFWSLLQLGFLLLSVRILWRMHGSPGNYVHWLGFSFAPAVLCLWMGQTSLFVLFGLVLFLRLHRTRPYLAGMSLWLCSLKPHLFLVFGVVLLAWIVVSKSYKVVVGAAAAMAASCALVSWIDPMAWVQYARMMRTVGIEKEFIPCLSIVLRLWTSPKTMWLQYLPAALGCAWALSYYWTRRRTWNWMEDGSLLMLVSIFAAPYCWLFDQCLAIPALMHGAYLTRSRILLAVLAFSSVVIEAELLCGIKVWSIFYLWTAPGWLAWYLLAAGMKRTQAEEIHGSAGVAD